VPFVGGLNIRAAFESRRLAAAIVFVTAAPGLLRSFESQTFTVAVHDVSGSRVSGAKARLLSLDRVIEVKAKAAGELQFNGVIPGTYDLEVSANGFRRRVYPDLRIPSSDSQPMQVVLNPETQRCGYVNTLDYEAFRPEASILSGYVIYEDTGKGISGVKIELNGASGTKIGATVSGPNGKFAFPGLPAGRYSVRASKNAYEPTEIAQMFVPRENLTILHLGLDKRGHMHICQ
jgi:carboxypeptidase family protein